MSNKEEKLTLHSTKKVEEAHSLIGRTGPDPNGHFHYPPFFLVFGEFSAERCTLTTNSINVIFCIPLDQLSDSVFKYLINGFQSCLSTLCINHLINTSDHSLSSLPVCVILLHVPASSHTSPFLWLFSCLLPPQSSPFPFPSRASLPPVLSFKDMASGINFLYIISVCHLSLTLKSQLEISICPFINQILTFFVMYKVCCQKYPEKKK